jgi:AcrR family transcriptional regulator
MAASESKRAEMKNDSGSTVRRRLPGDLRVRQILDAALAEFSARGFSRTRIDDIAARAGLSKGGIYTHFRSKNEVFETLLERVSATPILGEYARIEGDVTVQRVIDLLAGELYTWWVSEPVVATLRLLIAESMRLPGLVEQWRQRTEHAYIEVVGRILRRGVRQGHLRAGAATRSPLLLLAPVAQICLHQMIRAELLTGEALARYRAHYRQLLREWLTPPCEVSARVVRAAHLVRRRKPSSRRAVSPIPVSAAQRSASRQESIA